MRSSILVLVWLISSTGLAGTLKLVGINESAIEILDMNALPASVRKEIDSASKGKEPGEYKISKALPVLLSHFGIEKRSKLISIGEPWEYKKCPDLRCGSSIQESRRLLELSGSISHSFV